MAAAVGRRGIDGVPGQSKKLCGQPENPAQKRRSPADGSPHRLLSGVLLREERTGLDVLTIRSEGI